MSKSRRNSIPRAFPWREPFLAALREHGKVADACKAAGISRNSAYAHRRRYSRFRKNWDRAQEAGWDARWRAREEAFEELELNADHRAETKFAL